jgi:hypothetical protein
MCKKCLCFTQYFLKWANFFKFSGYFGRKALKQSGNSGHHRSQRLTVVPTMENTVAVLLFIGHVAGKLIRLTFLLLLMRLC